MRLAPPAGIEPRRRFLIVQIDGLSRGILDRALAGGSMRNTRRLLVTGQLERRELSVGLPSSTPAFQASIMYGVRPDIPGFHFYDKREGLELHFPERGVADRVERRLSDGRPASSRTAPATAASSPAARPRACGPTRGSSASPAPARASGGPRCPSC